MDALPPDGEALKVQLLLAGDLLIGASQGLDCLTLVETSSRQRRRELRRQIDALGKEVKAAASALDAINASLSAMRRGCSSAGVHQPSPPAAHIFKKSSSEKVKSVVDVKHDGEKTEAAVTDGSSDTHVENEAEAMVIDHRGDRAEEAAARVAHAAEADVFLLSFLDGDDAGEGDCGDYMADAFKAFAKPLLAMAVFPLSPGVDPSSVTQMALHRCNGSSLATSQPRSTGHVIMAVVAAGSQSQ